MASTSLGYLTQLIPYHSHKSFILDLPRIGENSVSLNGSNNLEGLMIAPIRTRTRSNGDTPARNYDYLGIAFETLIGEDKLLGPWEPLRTTPGGIILLTQNLVGEILGPRKSKFSIKLPDKISREVFVTNCDDHVEVWNPADWKRY